MNKWQQIKAWAKSKQTIPFPNTKHVIKPAFDCGGVRYYEFDSVENLPFKRGLKCLTIYNELDMRCDRLYLQAHIEATKKVLTEGKRVGVEEISKVLQLNRQLEQRLEMIYEPELYFKLASVVFFTADENPNDWEYKYAMDKIAHWKKHGADAFFLNEPVRRLIPFLKEVAVNFSEYSQAAREIDRAHLENLFSQVSQKLKTTLSEPTQRYFSEEMKQDSAK